MTEFYFTETLRKIYGTFGKAFPQQHISEAIFRRVRDLPDDFMDFALGRLENEISLPVNLGRYLRLELWPDYLDAHPALRAQTNRRGCPECDPQLPGVIHAWSRDGEELAFTCWCVKGEEGWTKQRLLAAGFLLVNPRASHCDYVPPWLRKVVGHDEAPRPAHAQYLESLDEEF